MKKIIYNIKVSYLQKRFYLYYFISSIKKNYYELKNRYLKNSKYKEYNLLTRNTDIIIDGFPRSANSYVVNLIKYFNPNLKIASHSHMSLNIIHGLKINKPVIFLIRKPVDAIISAFIREPEIGIRNYLLHYYHLHKDIIDIKDRIVILDFKYATGKNEKINNIITEINSKYELNIRQVSQTDEINDKVFSAIEDKNKKWVMNSQPNENMVSRPSINRQKKKEDLLKELNNQKYFVNMIDKCNELYHKITNTD